MSNMIKRLTAGLLCLLFCVSLAACGQGDPYLYFDSERSMLQHLKGVWHGDDTYYVITQDRVCVLTEADIEERATRTITREIQYSPALYKELSEWKPEIYTRSFNIRLWDTPWYISDIDYSKGEFRCMETQWVIRESGLDVAGKDETLKKLSDTPQMESEWLQGAFDWAIGNYEVKLSDFVLGATGYGEKLLETVGGLRQYRHVGDRDGTTIYSINGRGIDTAEAFLLYSDTTLMWLDKTHNTQFQLAYATQGEKDTVIVAATPDEDFKKMIEHALLCLGNYPLGLTADDILRRFESESKTVGGKESWSVTADEVEYTIEKTAESQIFSLMWEGG